MKPTTTTTIAGVTCKIEKDDLGLFNIFIESEEIPKGLPEREIRRRIFHGEILLSEWIVRGEHPKAKAIQIAKQVIAVLRQGKRVTHRVDPEGRIMYYDPMISFEDMETLIEEREKRRDSEDDETP